MQQYWVERSDLAMGGHFGSRIVWHEELSEAQRAAAAEMLTLISARVLAWSAIATRHHESQLTRINANGAPAVSVGPTVASLLSWAADAWELTGGIVNVTMLRERIAAERGEPTPRVRATERSWNLTLRNWQHEGHAHLLGGTLERPSSVQIDLDGVGKGWIADRAVSLLEGMLERAVAAGRTPPWVSCYINADGDLALRHRAGASTEVRIELPRSEEATIGSLTVRGAACGVATSGTGVHRWGGRHHLIDPRTGAPAESGIAQATVVGTSAREAEAWAKSIVIDGASAIRRAEAAGVQQIVAVQESGEIVSAPALPPLRGVSTYAPTSTAGAAVEQR